MKAFVSKRVKKYLEVKNVDDLSKRELTRVITKKQDSEIVGRFMFISRKFKHEKNAPNLSKIKKLFDPNEVNWMF